MIETWISASLLALTGWQGYRLGKEYGWWGKPSAIDRKQQTSEQSPDVPLPEKSGLGRSRTDFGRLLNGFVPAAAMPDQRNLNETPDDRENDEPVTEPATTLLHLEETDYPEETDQVPATCSWMDEETVLLIEAGSDELTPEQPMVTLTDYMKQIRTVQRKMTQLTKRRQADTSFVRQELSMLIDTYQLENDQSLDWLFRQYEPATQPDYGSLFDRIETLAG